MKERKRTAIIIITKNISIMTKNRRKKKTRKERKTNQTRKKEKTNKQTNEKNQK